MPIWGKEKIAAKVVAQLLVSDWIFDKDKSSAYSQAWAQVGVPDEKIEHYQLNTLMLVAFALDAVVRRSFRETAVQNTILEEVDDLWRKYAENLSAMGIPDVHPIYRDRVSAYTEVARNADENVVLNVAHAFGVVCEGEGPEGPVLTKASQILAAAIDGIGDTVKELQKQYRVTT